MIDVFFSGYGFWFYRHKRSQQTYKISCASNKPVLMPLPGENLYCFDPIKSIGYFSLIRDDEIAYKNPNSLLTVNVLIPLPDPLYEHNTRSTFINLTENLSLGFAGINADDCTFIIDTEQPYEIKFDTKDNHIADYRLYSNQEHKTAKTNKKKTLTEPVRNRSELTLLIRSFLKNYNTYPGDPEPMPALQAWLQITTNEFFDIEGLIKEITKGKSPEIEFKSGEKADKTKFCKSYKNQFK